MRWRVTLRTNCANHREEEEEEKNLSRSQLSHTRTNTHISAYHVKI